MCINGRTYHLFQVVGVEVAEVAGDLVTEDVVMDAVVNVVADVVEQREKKGPMEYVNLLIDWTFQEDLKLKR